MRLLRSPAPPGSVHEAAARWLLRQETDGFTAAEEAALQAWLQEDPAHPAAWEDVRKATTLIQGAAADPRLMAMRTAALRARPSPRRKSGPLVAVAACCVAGLVATLFWASSTSWGPRWSHSTGRDVRSTATSSPVDPQSATYRTSVGERAAISLPDGSVATLDTGSAVQIAYTPTERGVRLLYGQVLLDVAKHKPIPFQVYAAGHRITAIGTRFDVRLTGAANKPAVRVLLLEGVVKVTRLIPTPRATTEPSVTLAPGEMLEARDAGPLRVAAADVEVLTSWRTGLLTFNDATLGDAVAEMNRYTARPITLADAGLARLRISGVFKSGDSDRFAQDVAEALPVTVARNAAGGPALTRATEKN